LFDLRFTIYDLRVMGLIGELRVACCVFGCLQFTTGGFAKCCGGRLKLRDFGGFWVVLWWERAGMGFAVGGVEQPENQIKSYESNHQ
jgi:hypothetical protein